LSRDSTATTSLEVSIIHDFVAEESTYIYLP
jgi:hypothetical protein